MVLNSLSLGLLAVGLIAAVYAAMPGKPALRRRTARRMSLLAISGVLLLEAITKAGFLRWLNIGIGVFGIATVAVEVARARRQ